MAFELEFDNRFSFEVDAGFDDVFTVLSDIPRVSGLHPHLETIVDLGDGLFRWEMKKLGTEQFKMQIKYTCLYQSDRNAGTVTWSPAASDEGIQVNGSFTAIPQASGTQVLGQIKSVMTVPLPGLMKKLAQPLVRKEDAKVTRQYVDNLITHFGGGRLISI